MTADDLKVAVERHGQRRDSRPAPEGGDLLSHLRSEPASFEDRKFFVWVWDPNPAAKWAHSELRGVQADREDESIDFYQNFSAPSGSYILDFGPTGKFVGLSQVLKDRHLHQRKSGSGNLLLCRQMETFEGLRLGNLAVWRTAAKRAALSQRDEWQIAEFARHFLI